MKMTESDLAKRLIAWLKNDGWDVYQEVESIGGVIDVVAKRGPVLWAIECKLSFGLPVIEQATRSIGRCHYVSVAIPSGKRIRGFADQICRSFGIGVIVVAKQVPTSWPVTETTRPRFSRKVRPPALSERQKNYCAAGTPGGGHWTRFKGTKEALIAAVKRNPGMSFKQAIRTIDHHYTSYASARSNLKGLIETSVIPELKLEHVDGGLCLFLAEDK